MTLNDNQIWTIANALRVAAEQYDADALVHATPPADSLMTPECRQSLVAMFERQAQEARQWASTLEGCDSVIINGMNR